MELKIGDRIKIGRNRQIAESAFDVVFELVDIDEDWLLCSGRVLEDPNGWGMKEIHHEFNIDYDIILPNKIDNNQEALFLLEEDA